MEIKDYLFLIGLIISIVLGVIAIIPQLKRTSSQNKKDDVDSLKIALELAGIDAKEQLELRKKVKHLEDILSNSQYKVTVIFSLGDKSKVESASIEMISIKR